MKNIFSVAFVIAAISALLFAGVVTGQTLWESKAELVNNDVSLLLRDTSAPSDPFAVLAEYKSLIAKTRTLSNTCLYVFKCNITEHRNALSVINMFERRNKALEDFYNIVKQGRQAEKDNNRDEVQRLLPLYFQQRQVLSDLSEGIREEIGAKPTIKELERIFSSAE